MAVNGASSEAQGHGSVDVFDTEWTAALDSGDPRWLSYPARYPRTQIELVERVKVVQIEHILSRYNIDSGRVLEYACGSAGVSIYMASRGFDVTTLDISPNAVRLARRNAALRLAPTERVAMSVGDVFALPFGDATFDVVMSYGLLEHFTVEQLSDLLHETNRVLRPGGLHIVDIIHGRYSIRTLASYINFVASSCMHIAQGRPGEIAHLYRTYFENYYENKLGPTDYRQLLQKSGLHEVCVSTCRPFPLLAIQGSVERMYVALLKALLPAWQAYDQARIPILDGLGWMYLAYGVKPEAV